MAWADVKNNASNNGGSSGGMKYVKLETGTTQLRVIGDQPYSRWTHWIPQANDGSGMGVDCLGKNCPVCKAMAEDKKNKKKSKYSSRKVHSISVIVRVPNAEPEVSVLEQGNKVFNGLLVLLEQMGDLKGYDVKIVKTGTTFSDIDYNVLPTFPPTPLTEAEQALTPYTEEQMAKSFTKEQVEMFMNGAKFDAVIAAANEDSSEEDSEGDSEAQVDFTQRV